MSFTPVLPSSGLLGWNILTRTIDQQKDTFASSGAIDRDVSYFKEKFSDIRSAEELVGDRTLLKVALGAFGLLDDLDNRFFINRIISDGTEDRAALSNLLADSRYKELAKSFDFSDPSLGSDEFMEEITSRYVDQSFEAEVGLQDESFRLALNLERTLSDIGNRVTSNDTKWFSVMGNPPLRQVFEVALGLPSSFGTLPIDTQLEEFKSRAETSFGTDDLAELSDASLLEQITRRFLLQSQIGEVNTFSSQSTALTLLQGL